MIKEEIKKKLRLYIDILCKICYKLGVTENSDSRESMVHPYFHSARRHEKMNTRRNIYSGLSPEQRRTVLSEAERNDVDVIRDCGSAIRVSGDYMDCDRMRKNLRRKGIYSDCW